MELEYVESALLIRLMDDFDTLDEVRVLSEDAPFSDYKFNIALKCIRRAISENEGENKRVIKRRWFELFYSQMSISGATLQKELSTFRSYSDTKTESIEKNFMEYYAKRKLSVLGGVLTGCMHDDRLAEDHVTHINNVVTQLDDISIQENEVSRRDCHVALIGEITKKLDGEEIYIKTGIYELDKIINGVLKRQTYLIAARPSIGKTAFALTIMDHFIFNLNMKCAFISVEMTEKKLYKRMVQIRSEQNFDEAFNYQAGINRIVETSKVMYECENLIIKKTTDRRIGNIKSMCRRIKRDNPDLQVIFVDYIQKVLSNDPKKEMTSTIEEVSGVLTDMADDLDVVMFPLAQIKRPRSDAMDKIPTLNDLKGSGRLEEDADGIFILHRKSRDSEEAIVIVDKSRDGETGCAPIGYKKSITKFYSEVNQGASHI